ncbi:MAG: phenylalanine--tRNA ligase subunit alpha [Candidatus Levybacteria bacterium RIFCSPLOWO2_01_FULL_39_10]|nr:MAG: phenylalanine--tRNA ligase subunit alpha [Candidatus Levybacteria bacterium RIFCSPLOWO2_01_FULL_39_10]
MENELINLKNNALSLILEAEDEKELEEIKLQFLGRSGKLTQAIRKLPKIDIEKRKELGVLANEVKETIEASVDEKKKQLKKGILMSKIRKIDVTNPGIKPQIGHLHLVTQAISEITSIFEKIGFVRVRYPEVEWDWYAFEALNFPKDHPARDDWETFFIDGASHKKYGPMLLTPHTSSGQIREMSNAVKSSVSGEISPIKMLNIAKCYRRQSDVSHTPMFHQFEGLAIDKNLSIVNLKGVLDYFVKSYFGEKRVSRIRPYHFEFTEPSFEVDVSCGVCNGQGCSLCKDGWLELGGAGMVHPNVLKNTGIDPDKFNGFAFGWGVERALMMKDGLEIDDLRLIYSNKLEFLEQF